MTDSSSASNFDNYIAELHENLDRLRDMSDVDEQSSTIVADLAQAYSEHPSPMQIAMCLSALFCGQKNILTFLRRSSSKTELKKTKVEILQFLKFFVESAGVKILPHVVELKTVLLTIFNVDNASDVRAAIFPVLSQLMELSAGCSDMQNEVDKMATTFLDQIGLQSSKTTATIKGLCLAFLGLLCKFFPEHMRKYADPLLLGQYLKYLHEQLVKDVKFEMLIAAGAIEGLVNYLVNFTPSSTPVHSQPPVVRSKTKEDDKRYNEERIRCESDLKRIYIYAARAIQTQDQTNLNRYALVKAGLELFAQHSTLFTEYLYDDYPEILRFIRAWNAHDNYDVKKVAQRAYDTFLLGVANALKETNVKTPEERRRAVQVFQYFIKEFRDKIDTPELEIKDLAMGIRGYGIFANACKLYGTEEDVKFMFVGLIQRCEQIAMPTVTLSQAMDIFDERFYGLPNLIDALSAIIIEMTNIGEEFLGPLERLTVMTIDYYPRYQPKPQATTCSSVIKMILALQTKPNSYKPFISRIVTQALIRCCSHPLKSTVEQQLENYEPDISEDKFKSLLSIGKTITYENYLPLWKSILSVTSLKEFDTSAYPIFDRQNMLVSLYDEIIDSILHIIDRLDLSVEKEKPDDENNDGTATTDPVFGMRPVKPMDFQIFYNLVDFCQDLLPDQTPELFQKWIFPFLYDIIATSTKYPLVSGVYRFATLIMNICLKLDYFKSNRSIATTRGGIEMMEIDTNENEQIIAVCSLVRRFAHEVLSRQKQYRDDLLVSCLQFIISLPSECIDYDFADYVPAIQLALSIGLSYLPLAEQTINSLERWSQSTSLNLPNFYNQILPYLDDFLRLSYDQGDDVNVRAIVSSLQEKTRLSSKTKRVLPTRMLKKTKQIKHLFEDSDIRRVQFRILKYLGSLGSRINHYLIDDTSNHLIKEAVAWDNENHITFAVPLDDIKPTIHLDIFLPRIVDLALHSSDRQTKITACELLQSILLYMIGKSANNRSSVAASYEKLYEHLFPAVLELSCDSDTFTKTLFTTFMIQMIHWFTKNQNYENPETMSMLDTFMNGMISGRNASIRDFSGICLKEFLKWTVKHAGGYDKSAYLKNATSILKRILSFSLHPNSFKRLGSILAWNSIYTLYRESETLVDVYTLQLLYVFVESLAIAQEDDPSLGTQQQAIGALSHIERIIKEKANLFIKETPKRHPLNQLNPQQEYENWCKELYQLLTNDRNIRDINKLKNHLKKFKNILFSDIINNDEINDEHSIITTITSQDSVFNDGKDQRLIKPQLTSIRFQFKNIIEKDLDNLFGKQGELFSTVLLNDVKTILTNFGTKLKSISHDKTNINDYSTWFSLTFRQHHRILGTPSIREIEIPGQYTSKKKPLIQHHIKIVGFDEKILVLQSLRLPKRLTIRGHDENDYRFLIKGGEDIRQDQRIQALFSIMNDLYDNDPNCNQSNSAHITVQTYKVIPMSTKLGMIEWLDNTRPLKELIETNYTQAEHDIISQGQHPRKLYQDYVTNVFQKAKPTAKSTSNTIMYAELFTSLTKAQVQDEFNKIQSIIPSDLLRRAYYKMANSHEGFYTLRRQFITSYAVLCTSHYILGIGDRHQSNFLIDTSSGQVIGIDFGSAFNAATIHLPVPELIPIRLTRQLVQLMSPIGTNGLFRATMIHTMNALRENSDLLLSTMDVFIKEPLMEWMEHALKTSKQVSQSESSTIRSDDTYAKDRIRSARLKLNGINPAVITGSDLKLNNFLRPSSLKEALHQMEKVVGGDQTQNKRAQILMQYQSNRYQKLTVDEQIDCIIDQATDVDILGRSWAGLETFM
ncbi:unnamed protein product [Rotaria sordida]|uniref:Non-specific serine/threonine protein kinase n=1 Tax=Rotaria sordida TaxID=392033 RepID=A0A814IVR5_9BILA|nr:unnamed protein product [Rotaria sordida]